MLLVVSDNRRSDPESQLVSDPFEKSRGSISRPQTLSRGCGKHICAMQGKFLEEMRMNLQTVILIAAGMAMVAFLIQDAEDYSRFIYIFTS